ncbi:MAG: OsmC family protein [Acidimicrobiales bacterium]|jgi:putative redox protein
MTATKAAPVEGEQPIAMVSVTSSEDYRGEIRAGRHRFVADEGPEVGGDDEGPSPYQLLLAALVQCTAATLRMYANRKGWVVGEVAVRAQLLRTGDGATKVERIERTVTLSGNLTDEQRRRLAEIADRTPVTRTLRAGLTIDTSFP